MKSPEHSSPTCAKEGSDASRLKGQGAAFSKPRPTNHAKSQKRIGKAQRPQTAKGTQLRKMRKVHHFHPQISKTMLRQC
jgi:hypothetical protein